MRPEERVRDILLNVTGEKSLADYRPDYFKHTLEHIRAAVRDARCEAIEDCAAVVDRLLGESYPRIAEAIRALLKEHE